MAVTKKNFGSKEWGLSVETGLTVALESFEQELSQDLYEHKDEQGEVDGLVGYNKVQRFTGSGAQTGAITTTLLSSVTLVNEVAALGNATGGTTMLGKLRRTGGNEEVMKINFEAFRYPTLTVA
jgi:hypothetical protein